MYAYANAAMVAPVVSQNKYTFRIIMTPSTEKYRVKECLDTSALPSFKNFELFKFLFTFVTRLLGILWRRVLTELWT